jgi:hypothetical protein
VKVPHSPRSRWELRRRRRRRILTKKVSLIGSGGSLMVLGVLSAPLPVPIGFVFFTAGLYLVARGSKRVRHSVKHVRRLIPPLSRGLNGVKHRLPRRLRTFIEHSDPG